MKILYLTPYFWPHVGGVEKHVLKVSQELVKMGHQVTIVTYRDRETSAELNGIDVIYLPREARDQKQATWQALNQHAEEFYAADVIHVHDVTWWLWPSWWRWRQKTYITFHGWETHWPIRWQAKLQRLVATILARGTIHIGHWIAEMYWDKPDKVLYGGADVTNQHNISSDFHKLKCVFLGRITVDNQIKWYSEFVLGLQKVFGASSVEMTWVGDGEDRSTAEKVGKVTGMVALPDEWIDHATIVCANSYLSVLEAQARGKLVVVSTAHPLKKKYFAQYPGQQWLIKADTVDAAVEKVRAAVEHAEQTKKRLAEQTAWASAQSWHKIANAYLSLWKNH